MEADGGIFRSEPTVKVSTERYKSYAKPDELHKRKNLPGEYKGGILSDTQIHKYEYKVSTGAPAILPKDMKEERRKDNIEKTQTVLEVLKTIITSIF